MKNNNWFICLIRSLSFFGLMLHIANVNALMITNGDFETGDFSGWNTFTTSNGTLSGASDYSVSGFDVNGDFISSYAAKFSVGYDVPPCVYVDLCKNYEGGGISQQFASNNGIYSFSANIAVENTSIYGGYNRQGGLFSLLIDDIIVDSIEVGVIYAGETLMDELSYTGFLGDGLHTLSFSITREWGPTTSLNQYLDDVKITSVPEPSTMLLISLGLIILIVKRSRQ